MKQIVMFSGGASSSYLAKLVIDEYGKENTILLHTPTGAESPDADRFRKEVAEYLGMEITEQSKGISLWELIEKNKILPSHFMPYCTTELKIKQSRKFFKSMQENFVVHFGYGADEWGRVQKQTTRYELDGIKSKCLIHERQISNELIKDIIRNEWKICLPETYRFLQHNNCIPCFKGGKGHFIAVAKYYPEQFKKAMEMAEKYESEPFKDCTLKDIWNKVQDGRLQEGMFDDYDLIPCMCSLD